MATEVKVPSVGESITSGVLASWRVNDGDFVKRDQPIFDLETDKITSEGLASANGRISLKVDEGEEVKIGQVVAEIDESDESPGDSGDAEKRGEKSGDKETSPDKKKRDTGDSESTPPLSPAARRAAEETNVDTAKIKGSGKDGRITKSDVLAAAESESDNEREKEEPDDSGETEQEEERKVPKKESPPAPSETGERTKRRKLSPLRRRIAERLVASQRETATLTTFNDVDLHTVKALRARHQDGFVEKHGIKLGFMSFFVKAAVHALKEVPQVNTQLDGDTLVENHFYDISVAVSTEKGLLVPVIRDCDRISYAEIERRIADVAKRAKEGKIQFDELEGGVFTITNGGIFGSVLSTPIINPPQSAILGMHSIQDRPTVVDGEIKIRPIMQLALSYDHRVVDGREAVTFLRKIKEALEDPTRTLLEL